MKTVDEITREAVEKNAYVVEHHFGVFKCQIALLDFARTTGRFEKQEEAEAVVKDLRAWLSKIVTAAIEEALALCPVPGPVTEERLGMVRLAVAHRDQARGAWQSVDPYPGTFIDDLLKHIDHLTRCLHDCGQDGSAQQWSAGYRKGLEDAAVLPVVSESV